MVVGPPHHTPTIPATHTRRTAVRPRMGASTDDEHTTDKHDESDSAQFGDDPHNLRNTPFEEAACVDCNAYLVKARGYQGECRCLQCARTHHQLTFGSGQPVGEWYPVIDYRKPTPPTHHTPRTTPTNPWQWGCFYCSEIGTALNPDHATAMHKIHVGYSCPAAPGLTILQIKRRIERRQTITNLYPDTTPQMHLQQNDDGTYHAAFGPGETTP